MEFTQTSSEYEYGHFLHVALRVPNHPLLHNSYFTVNRSIQTTFISVVTVLLHSLDRDKTLYSQQKCSGTVTFWGLTSLWVYQELDGMVRETGPGW